MSFDRDAKAYRDRRAARLKTFETRERQWAEAARGLGPVERKRWLLDFDLDNWQPATACERPDVQEWLAAGDFDTRKRKTFCWVLTTQALAKLAYFDETKPERSCDHCGESYRGPAVYCSMECAVADA